jgi:phosphoenolpyruvate carboxylase
MQDRDRNELEHALRRAASRGHLGRALGKGDELAELCEQAGDAMEHPLRDQAADQMRQMDLAELSELVRVGTVRFHLLNKAEQLNIVRVNREREPRTASDPARPESLDDAIGRLAAAGWDASRVWTLLSELDVEPTLTAHPTEARRRTVLEKQLEIARCVVSLREPTLPQSERRPLSRDWNGSSRCCWRPMMCDRADSMYQTRSATGSTS